jgi:2-polyprenyl-6-methoxyphenol hydroxylase-like FAD-dependent oxidoreductase
LTSPEERPNLKAESTSDVTTALGGGLGLSPNGIRVFESLDKAIFERIKAAGVEVDAFAMQLSSGRMLGKFATGGKRYGHGTLLVMRATLHDSVLERIDRKDISFEKKVKSVVDGDTSAKIEFEDGEIVEADLVIGADGVWGETRKAIPESAALKAEYE